MLDPGQFWRQRFATGRTGPARCAARRLLLRQLGRNGRAILVAGLDEQLALLGRERLALGAEADAFVMGQFQRELLNLQFPSLELGLALGQFGPQRFNLSLNPIRQSGNRGSQSRISAGVHASNYTIRESANPFDYKGFSAIGPAQTCQCEDGTASSRRQSTPLTSQSH